VLCHSTLQRWISGRHYILRIHLSLVPLSGCINPMAAMTYRLYVTVGPEGGRGNGILKIQLILMGFWLRTIVADIEKTVSGPQTFGELSVMGYYFKCLHLFLNPIYI
jgi:hypothetical protein